MGAYGSLRECVASLRICCGALASPWKLTPSLSLWPSKKRRDAKTTRCEGGAKRSVSIFASIQNIKRPPVYSFLVFLELAWLSWFFRTACSEKSTCPKWIKLQVFQDTKKALAENQPTFPTRKWWFLPRKKGKMDTFPKSPKVAGVGFWGPKLSKKSFFCKQNTGAKKNT